MKRSHAVSVIVHRNHKIDFHFHLIKDKEKRTFFFYIHRISVVLCRLTVTVLFINCQAKDSSKGEQNFIKFFDFNKSSEAQKFSVLYFFRINLVLKSLFNECTIWLRNSQYSAVDLLKQNQIKKCVKHDRQAYKNGYIRK